MTHVSTSIFQGLFKNIVFRSVALVIKKLWAILDFLPLFLPPCTLPYAYIFFVNLGVHHPVEIIGKKPLLIWGISKIVNVNSFSR